MKSSGQCLAGKVAIVTGAARGQGASHSRVLAEHGARVLITDVLDGAGETLASSVCDVGLEAAWSRLDVTDEANWQRAVAEAVDRWGRIDILVNNAGATGTGNVMDCTRNEWDRVLAVNLTGSFLGIRYVAPVMQAGGHGAIVNVSSVLGTLGTDSDIGYQVSKAALHMLTKAAAVTLAPEIRVNTVTPGLVATEMAAKLGTARLAARAAAYPMGRMADVDEVSMAVLFLVSDKASFTTGSELRVDGGALAGEKTAVRSSAR